MFFPRVGDPTPALVTDPVAALTIKLPDRIGLELGEWAFDLGVGFNWAPYRGQKNPNLPAFRSALRAYTLDTPGVTGVDDVAATFNPGARDVRYALEAHTAGGSASAASQ